MITFTRLENKHKVLIKKWSVSCPLGRRGKYALRTIFLILSRDPNLWLESLNLRIFVQIRSSVAFFFFSTLNYSITQEILTLIKSSGDSDIASWTEWKIEDFSYGRNHLMLYQLMKYWHIAWIPDSRFECYRAWALKPSTLAFTMSHLYTERSKLYLDLLWNHVETSIRGTMVSINTPSDCHNGMFALSTDRWLYQHCNHVREASTTFYTGLCGFFLLFLLLLLFFFLIPAVKNIECLINGLVICLGVSIWNGNNKLDLNLTCKVKGKNSLLQWRKAEDMSLKFKKEKGDMFTHFHAMTDKMTIEKRKKNTQWV